MWWSPRIFLAIYFRNVTRKAGTDKLTSSDSDLKALSKYIYAVRSGKLEFCLKEIVFVQLWQFDSVKVSESIRIPSARGQSWTHKVTP